MAAADMGLPWVDPDHLGSVALADPLAHVTNSRDCRAGSHLYDHERLLVVLFKKTLEAHLLASGTIGKPGIVAKHQDVGPGRLTAVSALGDMLSAHGG